MQNSTVLFAGAPYLGIYRSDNIGTASDPRTAHTVRLMRNQTGATWRNVTPAGLVPEVATHLTCLYTHESDMRLAVRPPPTHIALPLPLTRN